MSRKEVLCEDIAGKGCGLKRVLDLIGGKWKILILCLIDQKEVVRYGELRRGIYGITNTMLATSLKEMETDGMVLRTQYWGEGGSGFPLTASEGAYPADT